MSDYTFVTARVATGAAINDAKDVQALVDAGVTHVIDCRDDFNDAPLLASHPKLLYLWNGTPDDGAHKGSGWFGKSIVFALGALSARHHRVYAHCAAGVNRGPSTAYAIMRALGFTDSDAEAIIRSARPQVNLAYKADADLAVARLGYL